MLREQNVDSAMMSRNFWICGACLPHVKRTLASCEEPVRLTVHPLYWGYCSFCLVFPLPTHQSIRLPTELITSAPQMREAKMLKPIETRLFEYLAYTLGKNPLKRIAERLFARQRQGSFFLQMLVTRFTTLLEEE